MLHRYPLAIRPFYTMPCKGEPRSRCAALCSTGCCCAGQGHQPSVCYGRVGGGQPAVRKHAPHLPPCLKPPLPAPLLRSFHRSPPADDPRYSCSFDIFIRGEEIISGAQVRN